MCRRNGCFLSEWLLKAWINNGYQQQLKNGSIAELFHLKEFTI